MLALYLPVSLSLSLSLSFCILLAGGAARICRARSSFTDQQRYITNSSRFVQVPFVWVVKVPRPNQTTPGAHARKRTHMRANARYPSAVCNRE
jgi:hypothetical protein